jgi:phosphoserine phosphatase
VQFDFPLEIKFESVSKNVSGQTVRIADGWQFNSHIRATLKVAVRNSGFTAEATAKFQVNDIDMSLDFTLGVAPKAIDDLKQEVEKQIRKSPEKLFGLAFPNAEKWLAGINSGAFKWTRSAFEDTGKVLRQTYGQTQDQTAQSFKAAKYSLEERVRALHTTYQASANDVTRYMDETWDGIDKEKKRILADAGYASEEQFEKAQREVHKLGTQGLFKLLAVGASIQKVYKQGAQDAAKILNSAGYKIVAVTGTFKDVFKISGARAAAEILNVTGYEAEESAKALRGVYNASADKVGKYMGEIWRKSDKQVEKILGRAGYETAEVEDAMKEVFDWGGKVASKVDPRNWLV